jgi:hypothetical protein
MAQKADFRALKEEVKRKKLFTVFKVLGFDSISMGLPSTLSLEQRCQFRGRKVVSQKSTILK